RARGLPHPGRRGLPAGRDRLHRRRRHRDRRARMLLGPPHRRWLLGGVHLQGHPSAARPRAGSLTRPERTQSRGGSARARTSTTSTPGLSLTPGDFGAPKPCQVVTLHYFGGPTSGVSSSPDHLAGPTSGLSVSPDYPWGARRRGCRLVQSTWQARRRGPRVVQTTSEARLWTTPEGRRRGARVVQTT